jgi:E3 ubiquitin-protein ligase DOA10
MLGLIKLKEEQLKQEKKTRRENTDKDRCTICFGRMLSAQDLGQLFKKRNGKYSGCIHIFHKKCVVPWIRDHKQCPICRRSADRILKVVK